MRGRRGREDADTMATIPAVEPKIVYSL